MTPVTLAFDPVGSLFGPSLMHMPSLDEIRVGESLRVTLTFDLLRSFLEPSLMHIPSLDGIGLVSLRY